MINERNANYFTNFAINLNLINFKMRNTRIRATNGMDPYTNF